MSTFVKGGGGAGEKVKIDGVKVASKMELTSYKGDNPLTIGQAGVAFPANTLFLEDFDILNGVNGEDLTDTAADQTTAVEDLLKMVNRKIAMNNGEGQYVWKKLTAEGGDFIDFVVSADTGAYPNGGTQDGYWYDLLSQPVDLADEADLIANNIRKGVDIFGIIGTMSEGVSGIDFGQVNTTSEVRTIQVFHNLGVIPKFVALMPKDSEAIRSYYIHAILDNKVIYYESGLQSSAFPKSRSVKETYISFESDGATRVFWPRTYYWIAIA